MTSLASVQIFGRKDSRPTQAALRFFRERRIEVSLVDIAARAPAPTELRRFAQRLGPRALLDVESKAYRDQGLGYLSMGDEEVLERLLADPRLLRLPLVRAGDRFSVGPDEAAWKAWLQA
jgi:arsenate reductase-like glutaredoxin family protein